MLQNDTDDDVRAVYDGLNFLSNDDNDPDVIEATPDDDDNNKAASQGSLLEHKMMTVHMILMKN